MEDENLLIRRIQDLARQCDQREIPTHTGFLTLSEQDLFLRAVVKIPGARYVLHGGYEMAERKAACFLPGWCEDGDTAQLPLACVCIRPLNAKFAEPLEHRDYLGALMNLGIEREKLGDILMDESAAWLICMEDMADYLAGELTRVRRTSVTCARGELPEKIREPQLTRKEGTVASVRLDALVAMAFSLSRSRAVPLIEGGQVFLNGRMTDSASAVPREGDIISVRHMGRFIYRGIRSETRKGRLFAVADLYGQAGKKKREGENGNE